MKSPTHDRGQTFIVIIYTLFFTQMLFFSIFFDKTGSDIYITRSDTYITLIETVPNEIMMKPAAKLKNQPFKENHDDNDGQVKITSRAISRTEEPKRDDLLCRQCMAAITSESSRIVINGAHNHTFANPHGLVFEIGCFRHAAGCGLAGPPSNEFSWFPPHSWRVAICGACLTHIGWGFSSSERGMFYGLILDRLIKTDSHNN
jgi:hypothetical protein